ncbi:MAG: protease TldD [candidate division BRC1 bacterium ADurb.BinA364]|nr:MAG: protease TldD [candidate division BRC1 bacterium ADurb.BinA364]
MDLVLDPGNLGLTIHESVGHATELDRALGMEESLSGKTFATPDQLGRLRYGSPLVNFYADNTMEGGLASWGYDDEGAPAGRWDIVREGILRGYSTSRDTAPAIGEERSRGCCRADHWGRLPIVRIPNLCLAAGDTPCGVEDLIAGVEDGIYIEGRGSFSIDNMRLNFQFGGDAFWRIRRGKREGMLKNVTYQAITPHFWGSLDGLTDWRFWIPTGTLNCGKGDPGQVQQMTHGAPWARFRGVHVGGARAS